MSGGSTCMPFVLSGLSLLNVFWRFHPIKHCVVCPCFRAPFPPLEMWVLNAEALSKQTSTPESNDQRNGKVLTSEFKWLAVSQLPQREQLKHYLQVYVQICVSFSGSCSQLLSSHYRPFRFLVFFNYSTNPTFFTGGSPSRFAVHWGPPKPSAAISFNNFRPSAISRYTFADWSLRHSVFAWTRIIWLFPSWIWLVSKSPLSTILIQETSEHKSVLFTFHWYRILRVSIMPPSTSW